MDRDSNPTGRAQRSEHVRFRFESFPSHSEIVSDSVTNTGD